MTVKEKMIHDLTSKGLSDSEAETVFNDALSQLQPDGYSLTLDAPADDYPPAAYVVASILLDSAALNWIDANCPQAWFRPMFAA